MDSATSDVGLRAGTQYQIQGKARFRGGHDQDGRRPVGSGQEQLRLEDWFMRRTAIRDCLEGHNSVTAAKRDYPLTASSCGKPVSYTHL